jgi:hypothetical protein
MELYREIKVFKSLIDGRGTESASSSRLARKWWSVFRFRSFLEERRFKLWRWETFGGWFKLQ